MPNVDGVVNEFGPPPLMPRPANGIGPPTSIGESVLCELVGLRVLLEFNGVRTPGDGEPALIEPDCDADWVI